METRIQGGDSPLIICINPITSKWLVLWDKQNEGDSFSYQSKVFSGKPTIAEVKEVILEWYNKKIDKDILSGFIWKNMPIWLSMENQFNYKAAYDIAVQSNGKILPTFKFGPTDNPTYYKFEDMEDLQDFYLEAMTYVNETLAEGWLEKDAINWEEYSNLLD